MPSPLGHALGGLSAGWLLIRLTAGRQRIPAGRMSEAALFAAAGMAADVDLLFGAHSGPTHGLGAAAIAALAAYAVTRRGTQSAAVAAAYSSHTLLDWLGTDTTAPIGIMALWPFSRAYYQSAVHLFQAISRRYWLPGFWSFNLRALVRELFILGPLAAVIAWLRFRRAE
jgi:inner membrane protein